MEYASNGKANAGLTLGIIGTSLAGLLALGGTNGASILGLSSTTTEVSELEAKIAKLESERYTDTVGLELYKQIITQSNNEDAKLQALQKETFSYIIDLNKEVALNKQANAYQFEIMNNKIDCCCDKQKLAMDSIYTYVNDHFLPGTLVLPASSICPPVQLKGDVE